MEMRFGQIAVAPHVYNERQIRSRGTPPLIGAKGGIPGEIEISYYNGRVSDGILHLKMTGGGSVKVPLEGATWLQRVRQRLFWGKKPSFSLKNFDLDRAQWSALRKEIGQDLVEIGKFAETQQKNSSKDGKDGEDKPRSKSFWSNMISDLIEDRED